MEISEFEISDILQDILPHLYRYSDPPSNQDIDAENEATKSLADSICRMIDEAILDEIIKEIEDDKKTVEYILPNKLFEV